MNKKQIIAPLLAIAALFLFLAPTYIKRIRMQRRDMVTWRAYCAGRDLERRTNSTSLVSIDPPLSQALAQFLTTPTTYDELVYPGDEPSPLGDGTATHRLYLRNETGAWMALRLQDVPKLEKFRVLGWFTPTNPPEHMYR